MRKFLLLALGAVMIVGCGKMHRMFAEINGPQVVGSGKITTVSRHVGTFKAVKLDGATDADITIGSQSDIKIEGDDNIAPLIKTEIEGDTLHIYLEGSYSTKNRLKVTFSVAQLESATVNGSGDLTLHSYKGDKLALDINGSGDVTAEGEAKNLDASVSGSGNLKLYGLKAADASVSIQGSGDAQVNLTGTLDGSIAGSGSIRYKGSPKGVTRSIAGSGDIAAAH